MRPDSIRNDQFMVDQDAPEGIGTRMLATQVQAAEREGFRDIRTMAAGRAGTSWSGYYVWPRLGYDGEIDKDFLEEMPDDVRSGIEELAGDDPPRFIHLMASPEGRDWWRDNGRDVELAFPLGDYDDNLSREVLFGYARAKAEQMGKPLDDFLSRVATKKGDGMRLSKADEKLLNTTWERLRKRLLEKKKLPKKPGRR
jgi:hypothetical protein